MKDIIYAGFAQLSYLDWHKLTLVPKGTKLRDIFGIRKEAFNQILTDDYIEMYGGTKANNKHVKGKGFTLSRPHLEDTITLDKDYSHLDKGRKIYNAKDARLFYLYSENEEKPDDNPFYPQFGNWEFIYAYNHNKVKEEMKEKDLIGIFDSGFQASVFKNGNEIMIAYRGSDAFGKVKHLNDWLLTNFCIGIYRFPEALVCALWLYDKVKTDYPQASIHITGHSMGGALAQYVGIYGYSSVSPKVVTWNGLGVTQTDNHRYWLTRKGNYILALKNKWHLAKGEFKNIKNYNISRDIVGSLKYNAGKVISVDTGSEKNKAYLDEDKELINDLLSLVLSNDWIRAVGNTSSVTMTIIKKIMEVNKLNLINRVKNVVERVQKDKGNSKYHSLNNFMPFFTDGEIRPKVFNINFISNSYKDTYKKIGVIYTEANDLNITDKYLENSGNFYHYIMPYVAPNNYKTFLNGEKSNLKPLVVQEKFIGQFNNMEVISGVSGGEFVPIKILNKNASYSKVYDIKPGNWVIRL